MNRFLTCTLGLACLAQLGSASAANAEAPSSSQSIVDVNYQLFSNDPVLERGDADLYSNRYNWTAYEIIVEHEIVDDRKIVCTIHSSAKETRWGYTKFRFPAQSKVIYTAPSGKCITGFRFASSATLNPGYHVTTATVYGYCRGGLLDWVSHRVLGQSMWRVAGDRWGDDHDMSWMYHAGIQISVADIDYSNLQYPSSWVAPGSFGNNFGYNPFGF